ncbi:hypothetical protein Poli38472_013817 [Pythium oligandrum]|uniref:DNA-directed DNA polymerase X domain-containing protein n=1 Tax=Pythium oligandrum TaxID=41045 RepID=A0A8K1C261_PYTOL|nr:hypothetical protein Poli38472_013817 [Pythium oligandrum]|eukprot:TMW55055.1 hypothetical protein Poli38472_013817 [Pythium oligandrum]
MPSVFELLTSVYEVSTVVTDVILNKEYIKRGWLEEYTLSIIFLVFSGLVMGFVGVKLDEQHSRRYTGYRVLDIIIGFFLGVFQLRVLTETAYAFFGARKAEQIAQHTHQPGTHSVTEEKNHKLEKGLTYVAFIQGIVRDVPIFIIQANATIHYRKWKLVDLWAVCSTAVTLLNAATSYVSEQGIVRPTHQSTADAMNPKASKSVHYAAVLFMLGQFVFRLGAILLVATTTGLTIVYYSVAITVFALIWTVVLKLAHHSPSWKAQIQHAIQFFPFFTVFSVDASLLTAGSNKPRNALFGTKLWILNAWRVVENAIGIYLAVSLTRYDDFGESSDSEILTIGLICGAFYIVTVLIYFFITRSDAAAQKSQIMEEDTPLYLRNAPQTTTPYHHHPVDPDQPTPVHPTQPNAMYTNQQTAMYANQPEDKRRFFAELDAFLTDSMSWVDSQDNELRHYAAQWTQRVVMTRCVITSQSSESKSATTDVPMGRVAAERQSENIHNTEAMARTIPLKRVLDAKTSAASSGKKQKQDKKRTSTGSNGKRASSLSPAEQVLQGWRVLLVPFGPDVSRKRLEIWQDMVVSLGGEVVSTASTTPTRDNHQFLHLNSNRTALKDTDSKEKSENAVRMDWEKVDVLIASAETEMEKLRSHYHCKTIPSRVKMYTPDWLLYVKREKRLPDHDFFEWNQQHRHLMAEKEQIEEAERSHDDAINGDDYESGGEDGSNHKKESSREIVRAPHVRTDTRKIQKEEEELQKKKEKLVNERIPIFHKLNPRFQTISNAQEGTNLKTESFVCQKSSLMQANFNAHLTDPIEELMEFLHVERDIWREYSYKKVVSSLKAMCSRVSSVSDIKGLWWAKGRMRDKVVEILETGKLEKLEAKKINPRLRTLVEMSRIWGVGPATAAKLYNMGYKTMDQLRKDADKVLNFQQQIGLNYYQDFLTKIPRSEVTEIEKTVVDEVHRLLPNATALACGSYRRGKPSSGDCDVLITDPDSEECDILPTLLERLHAMGFLTDDLTHVSDHRMGRCDSYMGVCQLRKDLPHRRLDIKVYPRRCFGFALLYFTGSDHFNRSMRLYARKKGWSLSDRALKRVVRVRKDVKIESGESVVCQSEVDVFIALGLEYKDPTERNCFDIRFLEEDEAEARRGGSKRTSTGSTTNPDEGDVDEVEGAN